MSLNMVPGSFGGSLLYGRVLCKVPPGDGQLVAYRITVRSLERQLVGEDVLKEFASLEDCSALEPEAVAQEPFPGRFVLVLEEDEAKQPGASRRP